jgi:hypothetical protein
MANVKDLKVGMYVKQTKTGLEGTITAIDESFFSKVAVEIEIQKLDKSDTSGRELGRTYHSTVENVEVLIPFVKGDKVKGISNHYTWTDKNMTEGEVVGFETDWKTARVEVKILKHERNHMLGATFPVRSEDIELIGFGPIQVGDIVKGNADAPYGVTDGEMTRGEVVKVDGSSIRVKVLEHKRSIFYIGDTFGVDAEHFTIIERPEVEEVEEEEVAETLALGDLVTGTESSDVSYGITTSKMTIGKVVEVRGELIKVEVVAHATRPTTVGKSHLVNSKHFKKVDLSESVQSLVKDAEVVRKKNNEQADEIADLKAVISSLETEVAELSEVKTASGPLSVTVDGNVISANSVSEMKSLLEMLTAFTK